MTTTIGWKLGETPADPFANIPASEADTIAAQYEADRRAALRRRAIALACRAVDNPDPEKD